MTEVKIERTGFVPGEYIFATAAVDNHSRRRMSNIRLILTKVGPLGIISQKVQELKIQIFWKLDFL